MRQPHTDGKRIRADLPADEDRLVVLTGAAAGAPVDVALEPLVEPKPRSRQDLRVEPPAVVDDDAQTCTGSERPLRAPEHRSDPGDVFLDRGLARPAGGGSELTLAAIVETEQLVRVPVLLVVVDQAGVRRRGDDAVIGSTEL